MLYPISNEWFIDGASGFMGVLNTNPNFALDVNGAVRSRAGGLMFGDGTVQASAILIGPVGATGPDGDQGPKGNTGPDGNAGPQGNTGPQGPQGDTGHAGLPVFTGAQGSDGKTGPQGPDGPGLERLQYVVVGRG